MLEKYLENPNSIKAIFNKPPSFVNLFLHELSLKNDGSSLRLTVDLNEYPDNPPIKWNMSKFNTVQVCIEFWDITQLRIEGWDNTKRASINITEDSALLKLEVIGSTNLTCFIGGVDIAQISAYQNA